MGPAPKGAGDMGPPGLKENRMKQNEKQQSKVVESQFKGKPVLALHRHEGDKSPLRFGLVKAGLILENVDAIKAFRAKHGV